MLALQRELAAELEARGQGLSEQDRVSLTFPVPKTPPLQRLTLMDRHTFRLSITGPLELKIESKGSLVQLDYVSLNERTEVEQEAWSRALAIVHVGRGEGGVVSHVCGEETSRWSASV